MPFLVYGESVPSWQNYIPVGGWLGSRHVTPSLADDVESMCGNHVQPTLGASEGLSASSRHWLKEDS